MHAAFLFLPVCLALLTWVLLATFKEPLYERFFNGLDPSRLSLSLKLGQLALSLFLIAAIDREQLAGVCIQCVSSDAEIDRVAGQTIILLAFSLPLLVVLVAHEYWAEKAAQANKADLNELEDQLSGQSNELAASKSKLHRAEEEIERVREENAGQATERELEKRCFRFILDVTTAAVACTNQIEEERRTRARAAKSMLQRGEEFSINNLEPAVSPRWRVYGLSVAVSRHSLQRLIADRPPAVQMGAEPGYVRSCLFRLHKEHYGVVMQQSSESAPQITLPKVPAIKPKFHSSNIGKCFAVATSVREVPYLVIPDTWKHNSRETGIGFEFFNDSQRERIRSAIGIPVWLPGDVHRATYVLCVDSNVPGLFSTSLDTEISFLSTFLAANLKFASATTELLKCHVDYHRVQTGVSGPTSTSKLSQ